MELVERDAALQVLEDRLHSTARGTGHTALIAGEAGIGKTSVLKTLAERRGRAALWWGACDALQTPHPLAPLHDIARSSEVRFGALLGSDGNRVALFEAVLADLQHSRHPVLFVIEDAHWADDATLDLLKFIGRRIDRAPCLLVISYRDDELTPVHSLRTVLGELPASLVTRIDLPRLSPAAVALLARNALRSPAGIHSASQGNPFFVSELLTHGTDDVPRSVQALVLARFARISPGAQEIVRLASIVPARIEQSLVEKIAGWDVGLIEECLNSGLLMTAGAALSFRHELARVAVEASLSGPVSQALHAQVLQALAQCNDMTNSLARLVHHATRAGDRAAVLRYAPEAAREAQHRGAHREAAAHYKTALTHAQDTIDVHQRTAWLDAYARECQATDQLSEAIDARGQLAELYRQQANVLGEAENLSQLALVYVLALRNADADAASRSAIQLAETQPPGAQLAGAYRVESQLRMLNRDYEASMAWGTKAIQLAEQLRDREVLAAAYSALGGATIFIDYEVGCAHLKHALDIALADGQHYTAANIYNNLGSASGELYRLHDAQRYLTKAISFAQQHEIDFYRNYCVAWLALVEMHLGRWDDALEHALDIVQMKTHRTTSRVMALAALGRLRSRRGDDGVADVLHEALELAVASDTLQRIAPVRAARAEAAYLRGDLDAVIAEAQPALTLATRHKHPWFAGELAYWMQRAGALEATPQPCAQPFALQIAGHWREAAKAWADLDCPYEQARALGEGDAGAQLEALALFEQLGARPAADHLRRLLRAAGVRGLPRGKRTSTQVNPHQLTAREIEVLQLLCEGLRNSEIAERLCRSVRTVDHHLAAVFAKLGVASRSEAVAAAMRAGIDSQNRQAVQPN